MRNLLILITGAVILTGCFQANETAPEPDETLKTFYKSLYSGDFGTAESLCDSLAMGDYISRLRSAWEDNDSTVTAIFPAILSEISVEITDMVKEGKNRTVFYELTAADGRKKTKTASLEREEGAWKIKAITDRH